MLLYIATPAAAVSSVVIIGYNITQVFFFFNQKKFMLLTHYSHIYYSYWKSLDLILLVSLLIENIWTRKAQYFLRRL